jgi:hypothetical protein
MNYEDIIVTEDQVNKVPNTSFMYGTWLSNYRITIRECTYDEDTKMYNIGVIGACSKKNIAKYLKVNAMRILPAGTEEINYSKFMELDNFK